MKMICVVLLFVSVLLASAPWVQDTAIFMAPRGDTINVAAKFGKALPLAGSHGWRVVQKTSGTSFRADSGWAADSVLTTLNYRTLTISENSLGKLDTLYGNTVLIDTLVVSACDTTSITGYAVAWDTFSCAQNAQYIQFGVGCLAGQSLTDTLGVRVLVDIGRIVGTGAAGR